MYSRFGRWVVALTAGAVLGACQDSSAPRAESSGPRFSTTSDTGGGGGGGTQVFHFVANGDHGDVNWFSFSGDSLGGFSYTFGSLYLDRGGTTSNPQTSLSYFVYQYGCDALFNCFFNTLAAGYGLIPNKDVTRGGRQLRLNTNTANNPNFIVYAGPAGPVTVTWTANGAYEQSNSGTSIYRAGTYAHRSQGSNTSRSANASGSIAGIVIPLVPVAQLATFRNVSIDIYR
jgi:hypothetical protein